MRNLLEIINVSYRNSAGLLQIYSKIEEKTLVKFQSIFKRTSPKFYNPDHDVRENRCGDPIYD